MIRSVARDGSYFSIDYFRHDDLCRRLALSDRRALQRGATTRRADLISEADLHRQSKEFLSAVRYGVVSGKFDDIMTPACEPAREIVADLSRARVRMAFTPSETAMFVFSLKQPLFRALNTDGLEQEDLLNIRFLLDKAGAFSPVKCNQTTRDEVIRHQQELLELSTRW